MITVNFQLNSYSSALKILMSILLSTALVPSSTIIQFHLDDFEVFSSLKMFHIPTIYFHIFPFKLMEWWNYDLYAYSIRNNILWNRTLFKSLLRLNRRGLTIVSIFASTSSHKEWQYNWNNLPSHDKRLSQERNQFKNPYPNLVGDKRFQRSFFFVRGQLKFERAQISFISWMIKCYDYQSSSCNLIEDTNVIWARRIQVRGKRPFDINCVRDCVH